MSLMKACYLKLCAICPAVTHCNRLRLTAGRRKGAKASLSLHHQIEWVSVQLESSELDVYGQPPLHGHVSRNKKRLVALHTL